MKISLEWLSEFVDCGDVDPTEIADKLTMATAEVEAIHPIVRSLAGVRVGRLVKVDPIEGTKLVRAEVFLGDGRARTVCGAPNARPGVYAAFAPAGTTLAGGVQVAVETRAGHPSEGVLCSARELGLGDAHDGLFEVPSQIGVGSDLAALIPPRDHLLEIDNKSITHRPDLWGHYGFARELAAILGRELRPLHLADLSRYATLDAYPLTVDDPIGCPAYCCLELENIQTVAAPLPIQWRLHALGQRTFDLLVDLTNYIQFELGQPTHAFDGSALQAVRVAPMGREGSFVTLDDQERQMLPDDLMIWNEREPVAIAGVMGGRASEVRTGVTTRLLLESANFHGARIRRTASRLGLRTEASQRFEKNQPPQNARLAVGRFVQLLTGAGQAPKVLSRLTVAGDLLEAPRPLQLSIATLDARVGMTIPQADVCRILDSLGFTNAVTEGPSGPVLDVQIPPHRSVADVSLPEDIVEEIARVYGYDNIEPRLPSIQMERPRVVDAHRRRHKAARILAQGHAMSEVHTYSWYDDPWLAAIGYDPGPTLVLANPSAPENARLRTQLMPNLLAAVHRNQAFAERFALFELGHIYPPPDSPPASDAPDNRKCDETHQLTLVSYQRSGDLEGHYRRVRSAVEDVLRAVAGQPAEVTIAEQATAPWRQAGGHHGLVRVGGEAVGTIGVIAEPLLSVVAAKAQVVFCELQIDALTGPVYPELDYRPASRFPGSSLDVTLTWSREQGLDALIRKLDGFGHALITGREFLYLYQGKGLDPGQGAYTFRYAIGAMDRTLTGDEIEQVQAQLTAFLDSEALQRR